MASDPPPPSDALATFITTSFSSAVANLSARARAVPQTKDFHFFNSFPQFKSPVDEIKNRTASSLHSIAESAALLGLKGPPTPPGDLGDAFEWIVNLNDEFLERFDAELDGFENLRADGIEFFWVSGSGESSRAVVGNFSGSGGSSSSSTAVGNFSGSSSINVGVMEERVIVGREKKVPFHVAGITKPQEEFMIRVDNENKSFEHVWLERSGDGSRWIHPLEKLSVESFIDRNIEGDPVKPPPLEITPFKLVETPKDLREMVAKLRRVNEFAVDLEHNHYRSFQGLTCLMQISTRTEDFVVDTLKLRIQVGPYLREIFKDPSKRKVMHGANHDIIWLQRDFGIYVCNLFDTGQASRALQLERNSLEYLLHHFCGVTANKEYQNADWRLRPLPNQMVKYGREDTHYLLYIYDVMKRSLLSSSSNENDLLLEVYNRSAEICMQLYEKELLTDTSYLSVYGLLHAELDAEQLAVFAGLYQWRDTVARAEDESTGYILPNKTLIEIAKQMPLTLWKLKRLFKSKHPYVERYLRTVLGIIKSSIANSAAFQSAVQQLKKARLEALALQNTSAVSNNTESVDDVDMDSMEADPPAMNSFDEESEVEIMPVREVGCSSGLSSMCKQVEEEDGGSVGTERKESAASVQILKKPSCAFGGLFGNSASKGKITPYTRISEQVKNEDKISQIKSSVTLPFHYFSREKPESMDVDRSLVQTSQSRVTGTTELEEVIPLEERNDETVSPWNNTLEEDGMKNSLPDGGSRLDFQPGSEATEETMSPSELRSSFDKHFSSINESRGSQKCRKQAEEPKLNFQVEPFDYADARKKMNFDEVRDDKKLECEEITNTSKSIEAYKGSAMANIPAEEKSRGSQARRRQAFPPTGNRSMTYH